MMKSFSLTLKQQSLKLNTRNEMKLWTIQGIDIYEQLMKEGYVFCTKPQFADSPSFIRSYQWMAMQMRERIGEPPVKVIEYPMWAWFQYNSAKDKKPPRNPANIREGLSAYMEIELPQTDILLSDFQCWHHVLNGWYITQNKKLGKKIDSLDKQAGKLLGFEDYPIDIQKEIESEWPLVFDIDKQNRWFAPQRKRNKSIQATFWMLKKENVISTELLERKGEIIKRVG